MAIQSSSFALAQSQKAQFVSPPFSSMEELISFNKEREDSQQTLKKSRCVSTSPAVNDKESTATPSPSETSGSGLEEVNKPTILGESPNTRPFTDIDAALALLDMKVDTGLNDPELAEFWSTIAPVNNTAGLEQQTRFYNSRESMSIGTDTAEIDRTGIVPCRGWFPLSDAQIAETSHDSDETVSEGESEEDEEEEQNDTPVLEPTREKGPTRTPRPASPAPSSRLMKKPKSRKGQINGRSQDELPDEKTEEVSSSRQKGTKSRANISAPKRFAQ